MFSPFVGLYFDFFQLFYYVIDQLNYGHLDSCLIIKLNFVYLYIYIYTYVYKC